MSEGVLGPRALNRALLQRQGPTIAAIEGWANFATQRNAIETRVLQHTGAAAAPGRPR